jgi:GT2 family glycosyltransferase
MRPDGLPRRKLVSVIIPHRDTPAALERCLRSLLDQKAASPFEIIVADSSAKPLAGLACDPRVQVLSLPPNGPGPARNAAVAAARGAYLAFIDADCHVPPDWVDSVRSAFESRPDADLLGGRIETRATDGDGCTTSGVYDQVFSYKQHRFVRKLRFAVTANLAVRADVFAQVGGFAGVDILEDLDWCQRAARLGHRIEYADEMLVFHAPRSLPELVGRWRRQVHQEYHTHAAANRGRWSYMVLIGKVVVATPAALVYLMLYPGCALSDRLRTVPVVWEVRAARVAAMVRLARNPGSPRPPWNG